MDIENLNLKKELIEKLNKLIDLCKNDGFIIKPYCGLRSLEDQAKLWRQSRTVLAVEYTRKDLLKKGCDFIVKVLDSVGPQPNKSWATNALPGQSWHNWGEACDCYILDENHKAIWDGSHKNYKIYGENAKSLGLRWGGDFHNADPVHIQLNEKEISEIYSIKEINDHFKP